MDKTGETQECRSVVDSDKKILHDLSLTIPDGEVHAVMGPNGTGKSTLSKNLNAILVPTQGDIYIDGMNTKDESKLWNIRQTAGMVFQNPDNQIVATIVEEDVAFGPENLGVEPTLIRERVEDALKSVGIYELKDRQPHLLSGGQKQRIAIVRALLMEPDLMLFDEPTSALDPEMIGEVTDLMREIALGGMTMIVVSHEMNFIENFTTKVLFMDEGKIIEENTPEELFNNPKDKRLKEFLSALNENKA